MSHVLSQVQLSVIVGSTLRAYIRRVVAIVRRGARIVTSPLIFEGRLADEVAFGCSGTGGDKRHVT